MNAKEYLMQVGIIDAKLKTVEANIRKLRDEILTLDDVSLSSSWPDGQPHGTKTTDPTGSQGTRLADANNERREKLRKELLDYEYQEVTLRSKLWNKRMQTIEMIAHIMDSGDVMAKTYYTLLTMRYVDGASWEEIAVEIGYTWRHTIRLHGEALKKIGLLIGESQ